MEDIIFSNIFDFTFKGTEVTHIGIGCSCNPYVTLFCDFVVAKNVKPKKNPSNNDWMPLISGDKCAAECKDNEDNKEKKEF